MLTSQVNFKREIQSTVTAADLCDGGISVLNHCLSWSKFVNSRHWLNIHIMYLNDRVSKSYYYFSGVLLNKKMFEQFGIDNMRSWNI